MEVYGENIDVYHFFVNNRTHYIKLVVVCIFIFLLLAVAWVSVIATDFLGEDGGIIIGVSAVGLPFLIFFLLKRRTAEECTARLYDDRIEFVRNELPITIRFSDIEKYYVLIDLNSDEDYNKVVLKINTTMGRKVRLKATADVCDIEPFQDLCTNFDALAAQKQIAKKFILW